MIGVTPVLHWTRRMLGLSPTTAECLPRFGAHGINLSFDPDNYCSFKNFYVGNDVFVESGAIFMASESRIWIGNKVMFGPQVTTIWEGPQHDGDWLLLFDLKEKRPEDDADIVIEDDVGVGIKLSFHKGIT